MSDREQRIRERAHKIWEDEGCPEGQNQRHWDMAARQIDGEPDSENPSQPAPGEQQVSKSTVEETTSPPTGEEQRRQTAARAEEKSRNTKRPAR